ncbi:MULTISPECIES: cellulose biosynthesis cyclic di-GMP-binding regulatory protein BcsB [unclassified Pseudomonas]|uniref:cellulose biosynthesis cyclic di-GMP-binding regulatory protein BcsB n=1 Tax=unclassified Pseudomonas TaxID=196821 RepID=UPI001199C56E|nr:MULTISPECIES: cellulose biosynthesis cyclic di-GMP-binding regulatory protein BcsB [unclassified Pseudomonas]TWC18463.1 cellulose synthase subunit [Pseudomonas sp. SJZ075]TWC23468.1 cellulose synthase subunit [Pseudomonas sp. SJZ074]TWC34766.1 cellulose synthase subunit [Pseudomonas sp. SJZ078]TWC40585.1 cellulose synthase subunit [Pseudomonas sp. SJZ085]TWC55488.1 cellulose synthase subunit [Pseudomonas sp. SJZ124]
MSRYFRRSLVAGLALLAIGEAQAQGLVSPVVGAPPELGPVPSWSNTYSFGQLGQPGDNLLLGIHDSEQIEFSLRRDRIASDARLRLEYTPSPALLPVLSHLRVYLNDVLVSALPIEKDQLGRKTFRDVALDPLLITDFNRVRLEFIGHYTDICEDPANNALWVNIGRRSEIELHEQALSLKNDLAYFPLPFFDARGQEKPTLSMVFAAAPTLGEQRAAGVLASYFGSRAGWRGMRFPVLFDQLPEADDGTATTPAIVFATNDHRPSFLADLERFPKVQAPVLQIIENPRAPHSKVLLVLGRNDEDLLVATRALALGGDLLRGSRATVDKVQQLQPRQPYDAPNWIRTDRPVRFAELISYPGQLQASGLRPAPISVDLNLPPDLFVWRSQGIPLKLNYRYTPSVVTDESRLNISLNDQFISSFPLPANDSSKLQGLRLAVLSSDPANPTEKVFVPALKVGERNTLRFDFNFASTIGSAQRDHCQTSLPASNQSTIDENSTLDLSGYHHFIAMPDLKAFARSGFPFNRMADLSQTLVMVPTQGSAVEISTLLETLATIGARSGAPALGLQLSDDWGVAARTDADLLVMGGLGAGVGDSANANLMLNQLNDWLLEPSNQMPSGSSARAGQLNDIREQAAHRVEVSAQAPIAAFVGLKSPFHEQRSIVALLAHDDADYQLLRDTLADGAKMDAVAGSVALLRSSGVESSQVGEQYFVGHLPWWLLLWFQLSEHPVLLAMTVVLIVLLIAFMLWRSLSWIARRRLAGRE